MPLARKSKKKGLQATTAGVVNRKKQRVVRATGLADADHNQKLRELACEECGKKYFANSSDIPARLCPECRRGRKGMETRGVKNDQPAQTQWTVAQAKARFSEVIDKAATGGPQTITRNGKRAAVVVSAEEWERKTRRKGTLVEFFQSSPLRGVELDLERLKDPPRDIDL